MTNAITPDFSALSDAVLAKANEEASSLHAMAAELKKSSGSIEAVRTWLDASDDPEIIKEREQIALFVAKLQEKKVALEARAKAAMGVGEIDREALQKEFKAKKSTVRTLLMQAKGTLEIMGQDVSELEQAIENLPGMTAGNKSGKSPEELEAIRTWARANGHEVADRGRIKADIITAFEAANGAAVEEVPGE